MSVSRRRTVSPELRREAYTMALYIAICLLAALLALPQHGAHAPLVGVIWGVTLGLALAHWFAFQLSGRLVGADRIETHDAASAGAQIAGAAAVAVIASLPLPLTPSADEVVVVELVLAAFLGLVGFLVARGAGASRLRSAVCAIVVLVAAVAVALAKN